MIPKTRKFGKFTYYNPTRVPTFPPCPKKEAEDALPYWNSSHAKFGIKFSVELDEYVLKFLKKEMYVLYSWIRCDD